MKGQRAEYSRRAQQELQPQALGVFEGHRGPERNELKRCEGRSHAGTWQPRKGAWASDSEPGGQSIKLADTQPVRRTQRGAGYRLQ